MRQPRGAVAGFEQHRAAGLTAGIAFEQLARLFIGPGLGDERFGAEIVCVGHDASGCGAWRAKSQMLKSRGLDSAAPARSPPRPPNRVLLGWPVGGAGRQRLGNRTPAISKKHVKNTTRPGCPPPPQNPCMNPSYPPPTATDNRKETD